MTYELRVNRKHFSRLFSVTEGKPLSSGIVTAVTIDSEDARIPEIIRLEEELRRQDRCLFFGWNIVYSYTKQEIAAAELFQWVITKTFQPCGEQCGTIY